MVVQCFCFWDAICVSKKLSPPPPQADRRLRGILSYACVRVRKRRSVCASFRERRNEMYNSPKAELLFPETEAVLSDVIGISQEQNDNDFNITDLL